METIISSIITGVVAITTCIITQSMANRKTVALIEYKLGELQKQVEKHNSIIERTFQLEEKTAVQQQQINMNEKRIDALERRGK